MMSLAVRLAGGNLEDELFVVGIAVVVGDSFMAGGDRRVVDEFDRNVVVVGAAIDRRELNLRIRRQCARRGGGRLGTGQIGDVGIA